MISFVKITIGMLQQKNLKCWWSIAKCMETIFETAITIALIGFVVGLAGKVKYAKQNAPQTNELFGRLTIFSFVLIILLVIAYLFIR